MLKKFPVLLLLTLVIVCNIYGQYNGKHFSFSTSINYTTSARIYLYPNSSNIDLRSQVMELSEIVSPSFELRYGITDDIFAGISIERLKKTASGNNLLILSKTGQLHSVKVEDGFIVVPVELFIYYVLPFSTDRFKLLMGGGAAYYYGEQIRRLNGEAVSNINQKFAYGIQVNISSDYILSDFLSIRGEMKFRDPEITVTSEYNTNSLYVNGQTLQIENKQFDTKININGVTFLIGLGFHF